MDYLSVFEEMKLNSITVALQRGEEARPGMSKFGGIPDLPPEFIWYEHTGKSCLTQREARRPLSFLAQVNCAQIREFDRDCRLPATGLLYFFYDLESMPSGNRLEDWGSARVFYYSGDIGSLQPRPLPEGLCEAFRLPELTMHFSATYDLPDCEEYAPERYMEFWEEYQEHLEQAGYEKEDHLTKLLGYADTIQGDMTRVCEEMSIQIAALRQARSPARPRGSRQDAAGWRLLFQLDTVEENGFTSIAEGSGRLYFYIRENDFQEKDFSRVWAILQFG